VPEASTVNERLLCPPGATVLVHVSLLVDDVLLGVVGVLSLLHAATSNVMTNHRDTETQRLFFLCVSGTLWPVAVKDAPLMDV
jgi:hypothetical protein